MIHGVDVASYQDEKFPLATPNGKVVDFAVIKATQGLGYINPKFLGQLRWARENGLSVGFYHFGDAGDIIKQADYFLSVVLPVLRPGDHLWFDWERSDISNPDKDTWLEYVKDRKPEHRVGLYCNRDFWLNQDLSNFYGDALWIADHLPLGEPPKITAPWVIHQHDSSRGIDQNVANFESRAAMKEWAGEPSGAGADLGEVVEAVKTLTESVGRLADVLRIQQDMLVRINDQVGQVGRQVADIPADETTTALRDLKTAVAKVQTTATGLPKKIADEINKRLAQ